jgi:predicted nicotinamide N-methyase
MRPNGRSCLIDISVTELAEKDKEGADLVFISDMIVQRESARRTIAQCKKAGPEVVAGDPLFTSINDWQFSCFKISSEIHVDSGSIHLCRNK